MGNNIITLISISMGVLIGALSLIFSLNLKRRQDRTIYRIKRENEAFNYYLRTEIPQNIQDRYLKNINDFNVSNFEYENIDRLLHEMRKLRSEIIRLNNTKIQKSLNTNNQEGARTFNYDELIEQLSTMTNIQYLFDLLNKEKKEQFKYVRNVLSDIVHTIRNPSSGMRAVIEILKIDYSNNQQIIEKINDLEGYIDEIENNLNAYYQISDLNTSLINENKKLSLDEELNARGKLLTISLGKRIELKNNICDIELDKNVLEILTLAITCIWENAISFSKDNGIITTEAVINEGILTVEITNDGPIIKKEVINKIFEQGFSTRDSTGRGLAIVKQAIEKTLNGIVGCENIGDENGVKFTIVVEVKQKDEQDTIN